MSNERLDAQTEPNNPVDKCAVCIRKSGNVVGDLRKGTACKFAKTMFFFLRDDIHQKAKTITSGRRYNLGDCGGVQVPGKLKLVGHRKFIDSLEDELIKLKEI